VHHINTRAPGSPLVVYGVVLLLVLYVAPAGIAGLVGRFIAGVSTAATRLGAQAPAADGGHGPETP
jgi:hypothetical protein